MDRSSVHDLVLDFAVAQHSKEELRQDHCSVVEVFRKVRPKGVFGRREYENSNAADPVAGYVCREIAYYVKESYRGAGRDELILKTWLGDVPQDAIVLATGHEVGCEMLEQLAAEAEAGSAKGMEGGAAAR